MKVPHRPTLVLGVNAPRLREYRAAKESDVPHSRPESAGKAELRAMLQEVQDTMRDRRLQQGRDFAITPRAFVRALRMLQDQYDVRVCQSGDDVIIHYKKVS